MMIQKFQTVLTTTTVALIVATNIASVSFVSAKTELLNSLSNNRNNEELQTTRTMNKLRGQVKKDESTTTSTTTSTTSTATTLHHQRHIQRILNELFEGDIIPDYDSIMDNYGIEVVEELEAEGILLTPPSNKEDENGHHDNNIQQQNDYVLQNVVPDRRWNKRVNDIVQVPYVLDSSYSTLQVNRIKNALKDLGDRSKVVNFIPRRNEDNYIKVIKSSMCSSYVGRQGGEQELNLQSYCANRKGIIQHEFIHALGLFHEQSRPDRDQYVEVKWENIDDNFDHNFKKKSDLTTLGNSYDYGSVMHYPRDAFTSNGKDTIVPLKPLNGKVLGQRREADAQDILDIRLLYQCISGPRNLSQYNSNRCTTDCKCWQGQSGCRGKSNACQGSLVCKNNQCVASNGGGAGFRTTTSAPVPAPAPSPVRAPVRVPAPSNPTSNGKWKYLKNKGDCLSVDKKNDNNVVLWRCYNGNNQKWSYNESTKTIVNLRKRLCLTWNNEGSGKYKVNAKTCSGERNQKWYLSALSLKTDIGGCLSRNSQDGNAYLDMRCTFAWTQKFQFENP